MSDDSSLVQKVTAQTSQTQYTEERGTLADNTAYLMRVPSNWNMTLIRDMDFASAADGGGATRDREMFTAKGADAGTVDRYQDMLAREYAVAGTARHPMDFFQYDPVHEIALLDEVLDRFEERFGKPTRVIQYGASGGGHIAQAVAENFPTRIDGAIAFDAHTPVWIMNTHLDMWFTLKALIGPGAEADGLVKLEDLKLVGLPNAGLLQVGNTIAFELDPRIGAAWRAALDAAQRTPQGQARIALALTIGQWPAWGTGLHAQPELEDSSALQRSMYDLAYQEAVNAGGPGRILFENAARGQQLSWNTDVDYEVFFDNGNEFYKRAVRRLYREAGLDLQADLHRVNAAPRIAASPYALDFWKAPGRNVVGKPVIPLLRVQGLGDSIVPFSLTQGYEELVRDNGRENLFRAIFFNADGHCRANVAESTAAIEIMARRLDSGRWRSTDPKRLNDFAASLQTVETARFASIEKLRLSVVKYNRAWVPE